MGESESEKRTFGPSERELVELARQGDVIYRRIRDEIDAQRGKFVAIHVDSEDYAVGDTSAVAGRELLKRHPVDGRIHIRRISDEPDYGVASRLGPNTPASPRNP